MSETYTQNGRPLRVYTSLPPDTLLITALSGVEGISRPFHFRADLFSKDPDTMPAHDGLVKALKPELDKTFKPAFLGRTVIIPYFPVRDEALKRIIRLKLSKVQRRLESTHRVRLEPDEAVIEAIAARCTEVESGARNIDNILTNTMLPAVSRVLLTSLVEGIKPSAIRVVVTEQGDFGYAVEVGEAQGAAAEAPPSA